MQTPFKTFVKEILRTSRLLAANGTCYLHLNCKRNDFPWCLHWREVCDGKIDCWPNPVDEIDCQILEENECQSDEYRCYNGQCIPEIDLLDESFFPDCLDGSDETKVLLSYDTICTTHGNPTFRCTDRMCRHWSDCEIPTYQTIIDPFYFQYKVMEEWYDDLLSSNVNTHINRNCWNVMMCLIRATRVFNGNCEHICTDSDLSCRQKMVEYCPPLFEFPAKSIGWKDLHLVYSWNQTQRLANSPDYICYDAQYCAHPHMNTIHFTKLSNTSLTLSCETTNVNDLRGNWFVQVKSIQKHMQKQCSLTKTIKETKCLENIQFECGHKCLSKYRLLDNFVDCPDRIDEIYNQSCSLNLKHRFNCTSKKTGIEITTCRPQTNLMDGMTDECRSKIKLPDFPTLCDGYLSYDEQIDQHIETDETNCEEWQCNNQYTRCDGVWNCVDGADETQCFNSICNGTSGHPCLTLDTNKFICLPVSRIHDGIVDCLGAIDEQKTCRESKSERPMFRCLTNSTKLQQLSNETEQCVSSEQICNGYNDCPLFDDESRSFCTDAEKYFFICVSFWIKDRRITKENMFCSFQNEYSQPYPTVSSHTKRHLTLANYSIITTVQLPGLQSRTISKRTVSTTNTNILLSEVQCHGGLPVYDNDKIRCLCPLHLYGPRCENQNQRVSMTVQIGAPEWRTPFVLMIYLIDDKDEIINSYEQLRYLSIRDCNRKFHFHLVYLTRPKLQDRNYSVRIDAFELVTLKYRASWLFPIEFAFLPVYRLSVHITIPFTSISSEMDCSLECDWNHGRCISFVNIQKSFCLCEPGWTGPLCADSNECNCSPDSLCVGKWKNRSVCVCPAHRFGRRCYLENDLCERSNALKCQNGGQCISRDIRIPTDQSTICSCPDRFHGSQCERNSTQIDIVIDMPDIKDSLRLHFIRVYSHLSSQPFYPSGEMSAHERATTFKRIPFDKDQVTIYWQTPFHLIFIEYDQQLYLVYTQLRYFPSKHIKVRLEAQLRCPPIGELLNESIIGYPRLRRVKYYHIPCQTNPTLNCFHDNDQYICLCTHDHRANCFTFDHQMKYNCEKISFCENGGECYQNTASCPTSALCACPKCYLGTRCQLSTHGFGLALDVILGYQIRPEISFANQPLSVRVSGIITILMFVISLINGFCCIMTFKERNIRDTGCRMYLLVASIISIVTMSLFTLKYVSLVVLQITMIDNRTLLLSQCILLDFVLKIFLQVGDWLFACANIERLILVIVGIKFNNKLSIKVGKWMIFVIVVMTVGTSIHEPLNRMLIEDEDERRIWCIVRYSNSYAEMLKLYSSISLLVHFIGPFVINIVSAFGIIIMTAKRRSNVQKKFSLKKRLHDEFNEHKHLLMSALGLIVLAVPRIILTFLLECIQSAREPVIFYLLGYFISYLPPLFLFIVFVLPSTSYKTTFKKSMTHFCSFCKRILTTIS